VAAGKFGESVQLPAGKYRIRAAYGGRAFEETMWINAGTTTAVTFEAVNVSAATAAAPAAPAATAAPTPPPPAAAAPIAPAAAAPSTPAPAPAAKPQAKFCTSCGAALKPDTKFCTNCGAKAVN
jgi:hypothetical protein